MADFKDHVNQAKKNLIFLQSVNNNIANSWDWQVTVSFYVAVHMINAHIASKGNLHYHTHKQVENALNPYATISLCKLNEETFLAYKKLHGLSRRARYLVHEKTPRDQVENSFQTFDKHLSKCIRHLNVILGMMHMEYAVNIDPVKIDCPELKGESFQFFQVT